MKVFLILFFQIDIYFCNMQMLLAIMFCHWFNLCADLMLHICTQRMQCNTTASLSDALPSMTMSCMTQCPNLWLIELSTQLVYVPLHSRLIFYNFISRKDRYHLKRTVPVISISFNKLFNIPISQLNLAHFYNLIL